MHEPLVKMLCHKGALAALCVDRGGRYMATSGIDGQLKLWDVRRFATLVRLFQFVPQSSLLPQIPERVLTVPAGAGAPER